MAGQASASDDGPQYVLLASGFELSEKSDLLPLQMLIDYVGGNLGGASDRQGVSVYVGSRRDHSFYRLV